MHPTQHSTRSWISARTFLLVVVLFAVARTLAAGQQPAKPASAAPSAAAPAAPALRAPAVPLVAHDPYFSIWSPADRLTDAPTVHWTGRPHPLTSLVRVDGEAFRVMGASPADTAAMAQKSEKVSATRTTYEFGDARVRVTLAFLTPTLPSDLDLLSRPVTYVSWAVASADGKPHKVQLYFDCGAEIAVNTPEQAAGLDYPSIRGLVAARVGTADQQVLARKGDDVRIDWGYGYLAAPADSGATVTGGNGGRLRRGFISSGGVAAPAGPVAARPVSESRLAMAAAWDLGDVGTKPVTRFAMLAYDDVFAVRYFSTDLRAYWRRNGATIESVLESAARDREALDARSAKFDADLRRDLAQAGGEKYAAIATLAFRQTLAATKLVADGNGQPLLFPKENFSNGCIGTVDVIYPMAPQYLLFGPALARALVVPNLDYASSPRWKFPFAPHDLGTYPHATGQVYGGGEKTEENQMPVEETGNMIVLVAAIAQMEGNADLAGRYWPVLTKWAEYLKEKGFDPENQLCTDDFAGHLAHNVNLSAKAIVALGAFARLSEMRGEKTLAADYRKLAEQFAARWVKEAADGDHFRLAFDRPGTWSQKYNLVWDRILGLKLFPASVALREMSYYRRVQGRYGLPLDNRRLYTKLDWITWTATLTGSRADFEALVNPVFDMLNQTPHRVPMNDWYWTNDATKSGFQARSVVGGVFLRLLYDAPVWKKWAGQTPAPSRAPAQTSRKAVVPQKARPLPLFDVRVTGGPLKRAQDLDAQYLLSLDVNRMTAFLRKSAGLEPKAEGYGGWDGPGRQLTGHIAGHYLSGVSLMYAATGDARFKQRADQLVAELKTVQDKQGDGYIGAQADRDGVDGKVRFQDLAKGVIRSGGFDLNGLWSPWYVQHKIFAGLRDAYRLTGNRTALDVEVKFAAWAESILSKLDADQTQKMLATEFGGMNEVLADLYGDTGDRRWLALSDRFDHKAIVDPLSRREDILAGKHGNTQVPKLLGSLTRYVYTGSERDGTAAKFFWDEVAQHHSFATGGHGRNEYFGPPDKLNDMIEGRTAETCNVYNLIKMARALFALEPDVRYADFHERALFNHILGSIDPEDGSTCYMVPVGQGVSREYQNMMQSFTCCVGSGMESHALHADGIYYESPGRLWVNLYVPSTAAWKSAGAVVTANTTFPDGDSASLTFTLKAPKAFTLALRRPYWAGEGFSVKVNGAAVAKLPPAGSYVELTRTWKTGDVVSLVLPKTLRAEPLPDNASRVALMWGPLVLAGDLGPIQRRRRPGEGESPVPPVVAPSFVASGQPVASWLKPVPGKPGSFRSDGVGRDRDVDFMPFYALQRRTYAAYWDLYTPAEWDRHAAAVRAAQEKQRKLEAATLGFAQPGQMQGERDANYQGENATPTQSNGRYGRRGTGWFSMDVAVDPAQPVILVVTFAGDERATRTFEVLVDGVKLATQTVDRRSPERNVGFFDVEYTLPAETTKGKQKVTVRFQATGGSELAAVYGIRSVRAGAER